MPMHTDHNTSVTYTTLTEMERGYADAIMQSTGCSGFEEEWEDISDDDFAQQTLRKIVDDCERFFSEAVSVHPDGEEGLAEIDAYDLGHDFFLSRQGTGVDFTDQAVDDDVAEALEEIASRFGWIEVEISDERKIVFLIDEPAPEAGPSA